MINWIWKESLVSKFYITSSNPDLSLLTYVSAKFYGTSGRALALTDIGSHFDQDIRWHTMYSEYQLHDTNNLNKRCLKKIILNPKPNSRQ
jgi:hypothetical protein